MANKIWFLRAFYVLYFFHIALCSDITPSVFGSLTNIVPAAFGDFNSDELTDLFVISEDKKKIMILLGNTKEPFFYADSHLQCEVNNSFSITSVVPGDFDGDALMDVLITTRLDKKEGKTSSTFVFVHWGGLYHLNCTRDPIIKMSDEPLAIDFDNNMTIDLFGVNEKNEAVFWIFSRNRTAPSEVLLSNSSKYDFEAPHSHAFLDLNNDNSPDLFLTTQKSYAIWLYDNDHKNSSAPFVFYGEIEYPNHLHRDYVGQNIFLDLETADKMYPIVPVCSPDTSCSRSAIFVYADNVWYNLNVSFVDPKNRTWTFPLNDGRAYTDTITLRSGDFNNDGYVDLLATLKQDKEIGTYLLENVPCNQKVCNVKRTFQVKWDALSGANRNAVMGVFYDFMQDGILDIIFVHKTADNKYKTSAFKNSLDYDANFIKVMVITGLKNKENELPATLLGPKRTFGTNLPGPTIRYRTTTQDGNMQAGVAAQLPQSAHFALFLPYTIFGLGRTPNFIEDLTVGMFNETRTWNQIIPNSQLVVIPFPPQNPARWKAQLFVTPSKIVWQTVIALTGTCVVIAFIIFLLHWKERREDRIEKLQEAHRFHFDAM